MEFATEVEERGRQPGTLFHRLVKQRDRLVIAPRINQRAPAIDECLKESGVEVEGSLIAGERFGGTALPGKAVGEVADAGGIVGLDMYCLPELRHSLRLATRMGVDDAEVVVGVIAGRIYGQGMMEAVRRLVCGSGMHAFHAEAVPGHPRGGIALHRCSIEGRAVGKHAALEPGQGDESSENRRRKNQSDRKESSGQPPEQHTRGSPGKHEGADSCQVLKVVGDKGVAEGEYFDKSKRRRKHGDNVKHRCERRLRAPPGLPAPCSEKQGGKGVEPRGPCLGVDRPARIGEGQVQGQREFAEVEPERRPR